MDIEKVVVVILAIAALAVLGWLTWISLQSALQARVLFRAGRRFGQASAIRGRPVVVKPLSLWGHQDLLWYRIKFQELQGPGRDRSWSTVGEEEKMAGFRVEDGGRPIEVEDLPTEVQSAKSKTEYSGEAGCLSFGMWGGTSRTLLRYLQVGPRVTVLGRLERRGETEVIVRDPTVGLLLSPNPPGRAAWTEIAKAVTGLLAVAAGWGLLIYAYSAWKG